MKIALAQISMSNNIDENFEKTMNCIEEARDCDLIFFPEIQLTPFFPQFKKEEMGNYIRKSRAELALKINDFRIQRMMNKAKEYNLWISPNLYIERDNKYYDMSLMLDNEGNLKGTSEMVHILQAKGFYERDYYTPSEGGFKVYDTGFGKIGVVICFDRHLPESIRSCALKGAELIIIPTANISDEPLEMFEWEIRVQAFQNNVFIAMCNRTGTEYDMNFVGESLIADCDGNIVYKADIKEQLIIKDIDLSKVYESRKKCPYIELIRK